MNKSIYTRPDKPRQMPVPKREEVPEREPLTVPDLIVVDKSTECFTTPRRIVDLMIDYADIEEGNPILEPSAGTGAIADQLKENFPSSSIHVLELNLTLQEVLKGKGYDLKGSDFLESELNQRYDRILQNPPFKNLQDIDHVKKAFSLLAPGGRLVSIMSPAPFFFLLKKKAIEFREWFDSLGGECVDLPENSFKESGTGVSSKLIILDKE